MFNILPKDSIFIVSVLIFYVTLMAKILMWLYPHTVQCFNDVIIQVIIYNLCIINLLIMHVL